ncbi:ATPase family AAA domain-containing protein 1 [Trametes pubescens]|uniref:ATPase family AAA domain-containing protein 1 n=1 Tax=Trametes pubescens TaxID=154538 RepID=A0A1M2V6C5_TRAPU|nr:ATPase family AAA domain-containing protein 1 [Trametes pubescens]
MRYHLLARKTRSLLKSLPKYPRAQLSSTQALRYPRKDRPSTQPIPRLSRRAISSETPAPEHPAGPSAASAATPSPGPEDPPAAEDVEEKPKRRTRVSSSAAALKAEVDSVALPTKLDILWTPEDVPSDSSSSSAPNTTLPPPEIFNEVLHNLHIVLHPQTQNRAAYSSGGAPLVEPTLALYCPIEGGDFVLDATVREMARRTGADVVVLDAVQLAAGECGHFGKAASALQLPNNPLQFPLSQREPARPASQRENDEDDEQPSSGFSMSPMTVHVMASMPRRSSRLLEQLPRATMPMARLKGFFDEIINVRPASTGDGEEPSSLPARRPRIIYVRDYPTLAASSSAWYPALLAAVRQRRQGPISQPNSPVVNPTAIVFGITPSFMVPEPLSSASSPGLQGVNLVSSKSPDSQQTSSNVKSSHKPEFGEDSGSEKAREKRVQRRLKRWARGISEDVPRLHPANEDMHDSDGSRGRPSVVVLGQEGFSGLSPFLGHSLSRALAGRSQGTPESDNRLGFFRASLVFPTLRALPQERDARMSRRREVNQLAMRMAVAQVGGTLGELEDVPEAEQSALDGDDHDRAKAQLWERWGQTVEVWPNVQRIADRAVGSVVAASQAYLPSNRSLEPTPVPWPAVFDAWAADRSSQDMWKTLFSTPPSGKLHRENEEEERAEVEDEADVDEIIEKLRRNPDLDEHEQRLLGCIVDTASITTTFSQVHLPPHTIDSVRTMVSLPLLHPSAFQQGILKEHSMTGCLLFGPPGTGKTLVVRALAKEAGCRMLVVSPSDIMDMYVGEGEKLVRAVFSLARRLSPCVVFVDELDALFGARLSRESGNSLAHRGVITEFMQEMDGLKSSKESNVIVIGATNRPFDLDDAVLRRLPRRLLVDLPGEKERAEILKILLRDETLADDVDLRVLAQKTESFSGSDLKHLCVSAALDAVKERVTVPWRPPPPGAQPVPPAAEPEAEAVSTFASTETAPEPVPPAVESTAEKPASTASQEEGPASEAPYARSLYWRNFEQALKEITPSASEALGTLSELRKWNDEFGEGRRQKKRQVWGKDRFGFTVPAVIEALPPVEVQADAGPAAANTDTTSPEAAARG